MPEVVYDSGADAWYIGWFPPGGYSARQSVHENRTVVFDYDAVGNIIGVEVL